MERSDQELNPLHSVRNPRKDFIVKACLAYLVAFSSLWIQSLQAELLRVGSFDVDATTPAGSPLAYVVSKGASTPLRCTGVVIAGKGKPIVLCAIDWIGLSNDGYKVFKTELAKAAGSEPGRVALHALHQHDAPRCDFSAEKLLLAHGLKNVGFDGDHARKVIKDAAAAVKQALAKAREVTHLGIGRGIVEKVASNRRILGSNGKVHYTRWTATRDVKIRNFPVGTIDPELKMLSFWNEDEALAALTWYATHPQSYYRVGLATPDFPGLARNARQEQTGVLHVHFNGAGGDVGAGKWNDGSHENRQVLADRVAAGMKLAWEDTEKTPVRAADLDWRVEPVLLPMAKHLDEEKLLRTIASDKVKPIDRFYAAKNLAWLRSCKAGIGIDLSCLRLGPARVLHMPGELLVEYQLNAQKLRPNLFVAMAAYGEYAPGYIGTKLAYEQGGYETSPGASRVAPEVESVLMHAIHRLLEK